uniref:Uncharacterized protein n=1 Tax=Xiphophorus couchianus TaxID=32473 RepID=A0A3B5LFF3_9TELE
LFFLAEYANIILINTLSLNTRSNTRLKPAYWPNPLHLTKTCPLLPHLPNPARQPKCFHYFRPLICNRRRLRRFQPSSTPKNSCILLNRPSRMDDSHSPVLTSPHLTCPFHLPNNDLFTLLLLHISSHHTY